ncbi:MAG: hypothetical protein M3332_13600 [Actinomycetota bacterium]|nr:hypothetical protein [Actinomycetota bacterium]
MPASGAAQRVVPDGAVVSPRAVSLAAVRAPLPVVALVLAGQVIVVIGFSCGSE